jgi:hypothetical protein
MIVGWILPSCIRKTCVSNREKYPQAGILDIFALIFENNGTLDFSR